MFVQDLRDALAKFPDLSEVFIMDGVNVRHVGDTDEISLKDGPNNSLVEIQRGETTTENDVCHYGIVLL